MNQKRKEIIHKWSCLSLSVAVLLASGGCGSVGYEGFSIPEQGESTLVPVEDIVIHNVYEGVEPTKEETQAVFASEDGVCVIEKKESYFDITLNYELAESLYQDKTVEEAGGRYRDVTDDEAGEGLDQDIVGGEAGESLGQENAGGEAGESNDQDNAGGEAGESFNQDIAADETIGSFYRVGAAYGEAILQMIPDYGARIEPYLYENIKAAFPAMDVDYSEILYRADTLKASLPEDYREELQGLADTLGTGEGFQKDGSLSRDELIILQMVPDALRPTACSAISLGKSKMESGERLSCRILEWDLGSTNQLNDTHAVLHMLHGEKSMTAVTFLGMMSILTAVNDDGVMIGEFDVGSKEPFICEGKTCYSYGIRYAMEHYITAKEAGEYLVEQCRNYTFTVNILLTDREDAYAAELCVRESDGTPGLRDGSSVLHPGLEWDNPDTLCIVNAFALDGNSDQMTASPDNLVRWKRFNRLFGTEEKISVDRFKELITSEAAENQDTFVKIRGMEVVHLVIVDYDTHQIQAVFSGEKGSVNTPEFIDLGTYD